MNFEKGIFQRTELLLGKEMMQRIASKKVIIFGIGGVGSWCAESLIRSGIRQLTIVDSDLICITNINRQLQATTLTVGDVKVEALKNRLLEINPLAEIQTIQRIYEPETSDSFNLDSYDFIIDAIDSLKNKIDLIRKATRTKAVFFSSMGASLKVDPTRIRVAEFWKVKGCPLGHIVRKKIRKGDLPAKKFMCVYSEELLENFGTGASCGTDKCLCPKSKNVKGDPELADHEWCSQKAVINGTVAHITAIFGFTLAGLVIQEIYNEKNMSSFDSRAREWDKDKMHMERSAAIAVELEKMIPFSHSMNALEYGAGTGILSFLLKDRFRGITLMDNSVEMIKVCEEKAEYFETKHIKPLWFDLEHQEFDEKFDIIYNQMVMHHVTDVNAILEKFHALLNPGGYLAIADLFPEDGSFHGPDVKVHFGFDPSQIGNYLQSIGFKNFEYKTCFDLKRDSGKNYPIFLLVAQK